MVRGFSGGVSGKEPAGDVRDAISIPGLGKSLSGGHGNPLLWFLSGESPWAKKACQAVVQRVAHNWSDLACMFVLNSEKREIWIKNLLWASLVARRIKNLPLCRRLEFNPWVRKIPWRREWQPTPVFLPGEFHEQSSLLGYSPQRHK